MAKLKVYVAMSGGVDSSVATALLKKQGHNVTGVFFKPWQPKRVSGFRFQVSGDCLWEQDRRDAMRVCAKLGIPFKTWDFSKEYEKEVVRYMIYGYKAGITPNPDVMCNKEIKFGLFLKKALTEGADCIATGHYVRRKPEFPISNFQFSNKSKIKNNRNLLTTRYSLLTGIDTNKDQSYFLWTLTQKQLGHCFFPIGDYTKPDVRKLAKKFGLPNHDKKDSQGVCFVGQLNMKDFLKNYIKPKIGNIVLAETGKTIGRHDGVYYYTMGQRHGLDIKDGGGPYYVVRKDIKKNVLYIADARQISRLRLGFGGQAKIEKISWVGEAPKLPLSCQIKIRYRSESIPATLTKTVIVQRRPLYDVKFKKPVRALTPGQSAVFYRGKEVLGGGIIT